MRDKSFNLTNQHEQIDFKKATERNAVKIYLKHYAISHNEKDIISNKEYDSVDISVPKYDLEFQVTTVEGNSIRLVRDKTYSYATKANEAIQKYIIIPISKKIERYRGRGVENIILLIQCVNIPPLNWLQPDTDKEREKINKIYLKSGFKSGYLVVDISEEVVKLFDN